MKKIHIYAILGAILLLGLVGCAKDNTPVSPETNVEIEEELDVDDEYEYQEDEQVQAAEPPAFLNEAVKASESTEESPVPFETWALTTISDGGWPKKAYVRMSNVDTNQEYVLELINEHNTKKGTEEIIPLEEHAEFLDYVLVEYEIYFPEDFTDSDEIWSPELVFTRTNSNENLWVAANGSSYYWMGSVTSIDTFSDEVGYPVNGDTITCKIVYPMIKDKTDYTLRYKERPEDLSAEIEVFFAID